MKTDTQTLVVQASPKDLFEFLAAPENLPKWAVKFCHAIRRRDERWWLVEGCMGELPVRYVSDPASGIIDSHLSTPDGEAVVPTRVVPVGKGAAYVFTQFQSPGMPDQVFQGQVESLKEELRVLEGLFES